MTGRSSGAGYLVCPSHDSSITNPASFMPPEVKPTPFCVNVTLPYFDVHSKTFLPDLKKAFLGTSRLLTTRKPRSHIQSRFLPATIRLPLHIPNAEHATEIFSVIRHCPNKIVREIINVLHRFIHLSFLSVLNTCANRPGITRRHTHQLHRIRTLKMMGCVEGDPGFPKPFAEWFAKILKIDFDIAALP